MAAANVPVVQSPGNTARTRALYLHIGYVSEVWLYSTETLMKDVLTPTEAKHIEVFTNWAKDVFLFAEETLGMKPAEPIDSLRGVPIRYTDPLGIERTTLLFDYDGRLVYHDLAFYTRDMFKNQEKGRFKLYRGKRFTYQQTIILEAYNRAINTFDKDSFDATKRWITIRSGHGIGKTATMSVISIHFLLCFFGSQVGTTANSENQLKDVFLKEFYFWKEKLPTSLKGNIEQLDDMVRIAGEKDWFMRARVSKPDKPEALAGLHGVYVLIEADEASGIDSMTFEVMKGALTGRNFVVLYFSNPTRTEGEFFESHKAGSAFVKLNFNSLDSPIVEDGYADRIAGDYGRDSDEYRIRVLGEFASVSEMDDKGWIPLFANLNILMEPERGQIINGALIGVDPSGKGRDSSIVHVRDNVYLKEVLNEKTSSPPDLARKVETIRDIYRSKSNDIGIDAFGIGAQVVANITTKVGETVNAILADKPRPGTEADFNSFKSELAWKFRTWVSRGGIIITNNSKAWLRELAQIKYKRDKQGRIQLMGKEEFKKLYGFSPDRFDAAIYTFFKDEPSRPVILTREEVGTRELGAFIAKAQGDAELSATGGLDFNRSSGQPSGDPFSSM